MSLNRVWDQRKNNGFGERMLPLNPQHCLYNLSIVRITDIIYSIIRINDVTKTIELFQ